MRVLQKSNDTPLILGKGGFGRQLADWLLDEGWGRAEFLDDAAPGCAGKLHDYTDPALLRKNRPAFAAVGNNVLRAELLQKLAALGYATPRNPASRTAFTAASMASASAGIEKLYRSIMAADRMQAMGFTISCPAMSGAEP